MTFKELEKICRKTTCTHYRARAYKEGRNYVRIEVSSFGHDKDREFDLDNKSHMFILSDQRIIPLSVIKEMDLTNLLDEIKSMMLRIHLHEFNEYFKYDGETVQSPHVFFGKMIELEPKQYSGAI